MNARQEKACLVVPAGCTRKVHITGDQPRMTLTPNIDMNKHSRLHLDQFADIPHLVSGMAFARVQDVI